MREFLPRRADINIAFTIKDELRLGELTVCSGGLVSDWNVRGDVPVRQPLEETACPVVDVASQAIGLDGETAHDARQHGFRHRGLIGELGTCSLGVHDDPELVINEIVRIAGEEWATPFLAIQVACGSVSEISFGGLPPRPPPPLPSEPLFSDCAATRTSRYSRTACEASSAFSHAMDVSPGARFFPLTSALIRLAAFFANLTRSLPRPAPCDVGN